ncbi:UNVERIFIED_CONTAM: hypothetical protein PYX00_010840 [Menopon gallinae]|uniref:Uncharacterized protein n=1 Tax=Menopon gallinae TaxID=328185 RepID=A0AAW2H702_9NEOP
MPLILVDETPKISKRYLVASPTSSRRFSSVSENTFQVPIFNRRVRLPCEIRPVVPLFSHSASPSRTSKRMASPLSNFILFGRGGVLLGRPRQSSVCLGKAKYRQITIDLLLQYYYWIFRATGIKLTL